MGIHTLLTIGALVLMGMFMLSANALMTDNTMASQQNELLLTSISLGQSLIEEAKMKAFDEKSIGKSLTSPDSLSYTLGCDGGAETITLPDVISASGFQSSLHFNDVDDYNGYSRKVNTPRCEGYIVSSRVRYSKETAPDSLAAGKSFCKTMTVTVSNPLLSGTVTIQYAFLY